ncbi:MAG: hypothetical protein P8Z41_02310 [Anaerolineales bacterium]|jgi:hypothetical protein
MMASKKASVLEAFSCSQVEVSDCIIQGPPMIVPLKPNFAKLQYSISVTLADKEKRMPS